MDLDIQLTNRMLRAGNKADLLYYYRKRNPAEEELFEQWPALADSNGTSPLARLPPVDDVGHTNRLGQRPGATASAEQGPRAVAPKSEPERLRRSAVLALAAVGLALIAAGALFAGVFDDDATEAAESPGHTTNDQPDPASPSAAGSIQLTGTKLEISDGPLNAVAYSPSGSLIAIGSDKGAAHLFDVETMEPVGAPLTSHLGSVVSVEFSPDGSTLATASEDHRIGLWDAETQDLVVMISGAHAGVVRDLVFNQDGSELLSVGEDGYLRRWDPETGGTVGTPIQANKVEQEELPDQVKTVAIALSPDGTEVATTGGDLEVSFWNLATGDRSRDPLPNLFTWIRGVAYHPNGEQLATAGADNVVRLYAGRGLPDLQPLEGHTGGLRGLTYSPEGSLLFTVGDDAHIRIWDTDAAAEAAAPVLAHRSAVLAVAIRPDGDQLATVSHDGELALWSVEYLE
jgi:WD40 repeat protein